MAEHGKQPEYDVQAQAKMINKPQMPMPKGATSHVVRSKHNSGHNSEHGKKR